MYPLKKLDPGVCVYDLGLHEVRRKYVKGSPCLQTSANNEAKWRGTKVKFLFASCVGK